jgi:restriction system protein
MARESLFAILVRSPWWLSLVVAAALFALARLFLPDIIALSVALPFIGIAGYAGWRQMREPGATRIAEMLETLREMPWEEFSALVEDALRGEGYVVRPLSGERADFELVRNGRISVVCARRWKAARTGVEPLRELVEAGRARDAGDHVYLSAGEFSDNARRFATEKAVRLVGGPDLARLLARAMRRRKKRSAP